MMEGEQLHSMFSLQANSMFCLGRDPQIDLKKCWEVSIWVSLFSLFLGGLAWLRLSMQLEVCGVGHL